MSGRKEAQKAQKGGEAGCPFCGATENLMGSDGGTRPGVHLAVTPRFFWVVCGNVDCRAQGPRRKTREDAVRAFGDTGKRIPDTGED